MKIFKKLKVPRYFKDFVYCGKENITAKQIEGQLPKL